MIITRLDDLHQLLTLFHNCPLLHCSAQLARIRYGPKRNRKLGWEPNSGPWQYSAPGRTLVSLLGHWRESCFELVHHTHVSNPTDTSKQEFSPVFRREISKQTRWRRNPPKLKIWPSSFLMYHVSRNESLNYFWSRRDLEARSVHWHGLDIVPCGSHDTGGHILIHAQDVQSFLSIGRKKERRKRKALGGNSLTFTSFLEFYQFEREKEKRKGKETNIACGGGRTTSKLPLTFIPLQLRHYNIEISSTKSLS